jgi:hypothetical protein
MFCGLFDEFKKFVEQWKSVKGYTLAIGEDLMIVGNEVAPLAENASPALTAEPRPAYHLRFAGRMKGMDAVRIEYKRKGASGFSMIGVLTNLPAQLSIVPQTDGEPESGQIRAIFLKKNKPFGDYSPHYSVVIAQ